jgi:hypothetical protein
VAGALADVTSLTKDIKNKIQSGKFTKEDLMSLPLDSRARLTVAFGVLGTVGFMVAKELLQESEDELCPIDDIYCKTKKRVAQDINTIFGGVLGVFVPFVKFDDKGEVVKNPTGLIPIPINWLMRFTDALALLFVGEVYKRDTKGAGVGDSKGIVAMKKVLTPSIVKTFAGSSEMTNTKLDLIKEAVDKGGEFNPFDVLQASKDTEEYNKMTVEQTQNAAWDIEKIYRVMKNEPDFDVNTLKEKNVAERAKALAKFGKESEKKADMVRRIYQTKGKYCKISKTGNYTDCVISDSLWQEYVKLKLNK